jgi:nucleoside-diphosphate-sugar epimerase
MILILKIQLLHKRFVTFVLIIYKSNEMKVLVTGANGLLGHQVVFELQKRQLQVHIIVRSIRNIHFDLKSVEVFEGNFDNPETLKKAAEGCDAIIHIAAVTATNLLHYENYSKINVDASAQIIRVANELNITKLVFISTANTIGFGAENELADEKQPIQFPFSESFYARSKVEAEKLFVAASLLPNRHVIIINPTFMIGAYDTKPSSGKLMLMGYRKPLMFAPKGGKNFVFVTDVAVAICNALTQGKNGERYLAAGVNLSFKEFYQLQKQAGNYVQVLIQLPDFLLITIGKIGDLIRKFGVKTELCSMNLRQLMVQERYSNAKATSELSMPQTDLKIAIAEAIRWFRENGKIR